VQRYAFALDHRVAGAFFEQHQRWPAFLPGMLEKAMRKAKRALTGHRLRPQPSEAPAPRISEIPVHIDLERLQDGGGIVRATVANGREL
jgi:hypothetical protein